MKLKQLSEYLVFGSLLGVGAYWIVTGEDAGRRHAGLGTLIMSGAFLGHSYFSSRVAARPALRPTADHRQVIVLADAGWDNLWYAMLYFALSIACFFFSRSGWTFTASEYVLPIAIAGFASSAVYALWTRAKPSSLTLSREGIDYSRFEVRPMRWQDVCDVLQDQENRVFLRVQNPHKYAPSIVPVGAEPMAYMFAIFAEHLTEDAGLLSDEIKKRVLAFGGSLPARNDDDEDHPDDEDDKDSV